MCELLYVQTSSCIPHTMLLLHGFEVGIVRFHFSHKIRCFGSLLIMPKLNLCVGLICNPSESANLN